MTPIDHKARSLVDTWQRQGMSLTEIIALGEAVVYEAQVRLREAELIDSGRYYDGL